MLDAVCLGKPEPLVLSPDTPALISLALETGVLVLLPGAVYRILELMSAHLVNPTDAMRIRIQRLQGRPGDLHDRQGQTFAGQSECDVEVF